MVAWVRLWILKNLRTGIGNEITLSSDIKIVICVRSILRNRGVF